MGRAPCCDKANVKKGPWSPEEDAKLKAYIDQHGTGGNWIALPQKIGLKRCGKSCRLRWLNYLRPNIKHGGFSEEEDNIICSLYISIGSRWSIIAAQLPGRTDNDIKNYWNTRLKKKLLGKQRKEQQARRASCLKQEVKRESEKPMVQAISQTPYWPEVPLAMPAANMNQDPCFKDQDSIRKLLVKLGGRVSNDDQVPDNRTTNFQYPLDTLPTEDQLYEYSMNMLASSMSMTSMNSTCSHMPNTHHDFNAAGQDLFEGLGNFPLELDELFYGNPQGVNGVENLYGLIDMVNGSSGTSSVESTSWADASSLAYPPMVSNYEACQQGIVHGSDPFEESKYFGLQ